MSEERRWFCKTKTLIGHSCCLIRGYPDFQWPMYKAPPVVKHEIPKEFWDLSIDEYINYFEHGVKPKLRRKCNGQEKEESSS